ncbi:DUF6301 family protein [Dactylosporangium sp. CA-233914]|uniref:DUF6301 family protein n=1 Tax=Dactylosporangium sp. CA-233914 TaxID=3239934 RepID=UPI003D90A3D3
MPDELRMLSGAQACALARKILSVAPMLHKVPPERVLSELGWPHIPHERTTTRYGDAGVETGNGAVNLAGDGSASTVSVPVVSPPPRPMTAEYEAFKQDAFSVAGRALIAEFGRPAKVAGSGGNTASLRWFVDDAALTLTREPLGASLRAWRRSDLEET